MHHKSIAAFPDETGAPVMLNTSFNENEPTVDTDFHPLTPEGRAEDINAGSSRPITIEDDVFIGMNSLILKGVTLSEGCVVGAGSVVSRDVPPRTIVAGNPAQVVWSLDG